MTAIRWIGKTALMLLQAESLAEHGALEGIRDEGLLESALARPINLNTYENETDPARLAAAYALGIVRNHPFTDGTADQRRSLTAQMVSRAKGRENPYNRSPRRRSFRTA